MGASARFQVRLANGEVEEGESLWGARHIIARRVAFDRDPLDPRNVLPAEIWQIDAAVFGGRTFIETIRDPAELSSSE